MSLNFQNRQGPLQICDLDEAERIALAGDSLDKQVAARLLVEVRRQHQQIAKLELDILDPMYCYAGGRISRHAIVSRNVQIEKWMAEVVELKKQIAGTAAKGGAT